MSQQQQQQQQLMQMQQLQQQQQPQLIEDPYSGVIYQAHLLGNSNILNYCI